MKKTICIQCLAFFAITISSHSQSYKNLVFEGAGIRGVAYVGAIKVMEERGLLTTINKVGGTSAGAIAALALALGYNSKDIERIIYDTKLQKFNDGKFLFVGGMSRMNRNYGWYRGRAFTKWVEGIIAEKTGNANITFRQLHDNKFKDLYVTGTSLNHQKQIVFSNATYPDMKIKDAVRISMSIPLYFEAVIIDSVGRIHKKNKNLPAYVDIMVDGGFTANFPIFIFDSLYTKQHDQIRITNSRTIGLRIDSPEQIGYDSIQHGLAPIPIDRFRNYVGALYTYVIENLNRSKLMPADWSRTVSISSGSIGPKIRKLTTDEKNLLIANGVQAMERFLNRSQTTE
jgi:NTE family protein